MEVDKNIEIINLGLWLNKEKTLIISDLHLGYEENLQQKGFFVPKQQSKLIIENLKKILNKIDPQKIIINGDLKHDFGRILRQEWKDVLKLIDFLLENCSELILIRGNHDTILEPIAEKRSIKVVSEYQINDILIIHGDKLITTKRESNKTKLKTIKTIIIGHEHPAISFKEKGKIEKYKCFLKGKWKQKDLIVMPSFNPLLYGSEVVSEQKFSPFLNNKKEFQVFVVSKEEIFDFGKVKDLK